MANLSIRKVDERVYRALQARAHARGVSLEEEVRKTLGDAVQPSVRIGQIFTHYFGASGVHIDSEPRLPHDPMKL